MIRKFKRPKKFHKKLRKNLQEKSQQVREIVPDSLAEKAANLNPLIAPELPTLSEPVEPITNETIAEHREEVLKGARKFIYPLQHSKHRILVVSSAITSAALIAFLIYCGIGLYKLYQYNTFLYRVTQVAPFPIARADGRLVSYENYLFELRHYVHYYQTQLGRDFSGDDKQQLIYQRRQALQVALDNTYIKILADQNNVSVSSKEVNSRLAEVRTQNRLGSNDKVFGDVLRDYWGWSVNDFKRSLKQQILSEKVVAKLDVEDTARAKAAQNQLNPTADFAAIAKQYSDAADKANGGDYGFAITHSNPNVPPEVVSQIFKLKPGQISSIINAGGTLEIVKVATNDGNTVTGAHISINLKPIATYTTPLEKAHPAHTYVKF